MKLWVIYHEGSFNNEEWGHKYFLSKENAKKYWKRYCCEFIGSYRIKKIKTED
jgi:hypothetical protein